MKRFLGFNNLKKAMLIWRQHTLSKEKLCEVKSLRINSKIYVQQGRWI